jgi:hypothetical protein
VGTARGGVREPQPAEMALSQLMVPEPSSSGVPDADVDSFLRRSRRAGSSWFLRRSSNTQEDVEFEPEQQAKPHSDMPDYVNALFMVRKPCRPSCNIAASPLPRRVYTLPSTAGSSRAQGLPQHPRPHSHRSDGTARGRAEGTSWAKCGWRWACAA